VDERQRVRIRGATPLATSASVVAGTKSATPVVGFVAAMVSELGLGDIPTDHRTARQLRRLSDWATGEGLPLDREVILDPDTVERFVEVGLIGDRSRAPYRAVLRRVGPLSDQTCSLGAEVVGRGPSPGGAALHGGRGPTLAGRRSRPAHGAAPASG
jgi:hypothetical protein